MPQYTIYVNATTDEAAVTRAYSFVQQLYSCTGFLITLNPGRGGIEVNLNTTARREQIVTEFNRHLGGGAYAS